MTSIDQRGQTVESLFIGGNIFIKQPVSPDLQNRSAVLKRVHLCWTEYFDQSHRFMPLKLGEQPYAVTVSYGQVPQKTNRPARLYTCITQVYNDSNGELLILGEAGSGKTILLLKLMFDLLKRAECDESHPIPVVFNLSSWKMKRMPLTEWLIEELNTQYRIPLELATSLIHTSKVLPLLDGLDGVTLIHRKACVEAINAYRQKYGGLVPMVVCSRSNEYLTQPIRILLQKAVVVQPLTLQEIESSLSRKDKQLVRRILHNDPILQKIATTPLILSALIDAYQDDTAVLNLSALCSPEAKLEQVFKSYVQHMLERQETETCYTSDQTQDWLAWLAWQMLQHGQTVFYIERMQIDWLPQNQSRLLKRTIIFLFKLVIGLSTGLAYLSTSGSLLWGLIVGLIAGLYFAKAELVTDDIKPAEIMAWSWVNVQQNAVASLVSGLKAGLFLVLTTFLLSILSVIQFFVLRTETLFGMDISLLSLLNAGLTITLGGGLLLILESGWSSDILDEHHFCMPNEGMWRSARNCLLAGAVFGLVGGIIFGLTISPIDGLICGCVIGLAASLLKGGIACIQHVLLRLLLWRSRSTPWNYPRFLNYAKEHNLLLKMGSGYTFIHRSLLEYFASLHTQNFL